MNKPAVSHHGHLDDSGQSHVDMINGPDVC